jgi:hypothetical protein
MALCSQRFAYKYFGQLDVEYESVCSDTYKAETTEEVATLREGNAERPSWSLNHRFEYLVLAGLPDEILKQRAMVHRARLLALVGPEGATIFGEAFPPAASDWSVERQRESALGVLMEVQRMRHVQSEFGKLRHRLLLTSIGPACFFLGLALWCAHTFPSKPLVTASAIFGLLGGYLSVLIRVGSLRWGLKYAANYQQVDRLFWNLCLNFYLSVIQGALGAIVLYFIFSSNVLKSDLFPNIPEEISRVAGVPPEPDIPKVFDLSHLMFAKLMVWSTIAGFSERFVPDLLTSLGKEVDEKK